MSEPNHRQDHTKEEIAAYLREVHSCVCDGHFTISRGEKREKNDTFINKYGLTSAEQKDILLGIDAEDFCYSTQNIKRGYEHETLYVFGPNVKLFDSEVGDDIIVEVYTKFNLIERSIKPIPVKMTVVISLHESEAPLTYPFREKNSPVLASEMASEETTDGDSRKECPL